MRFDQKSPFLYCILVEVYEAFGGLIWDVMKMKLLHSYLNLKWRLQSCYDKEMFQGFLA